MSRKWNELEPGLLSVEELIQHLTEVINILELNIY